MPIVLPFAAVARDLTNSDPLETLLSGLLARWTGIRDEKHWRRRLGRWMSDETTEKPLILLIADGLNERAEVKWRPLLNALVSRPWRKRIAVLATDRIHHWRVHCSKAGLATFSEITVEPYSPSELDRALAASGISHSHIPAELLPLISIPRYCRLVAEHYSEMIDSADFTRERLIYMEIKDRHISKLQYSITDGRLFEIIRDLAERSRVDPELNPKDLAPLITTPGGDDANIYEEIVGGGILVETSRNGMTSTYKVDPLRLIYGFGMLLADELASRSWVDSNEEEEFLVSWFGPQPDMDRKVEICGSALFHALFRKDFPDVALRGLIRYWLGLRNWADTAQSAFTSYVRRRPDIFLEVTDEFWSAARDSGAAQEFIGTAFAANRDDPKVQPVLAGAVERWMGLVHPLGRRFWQFDQARNEQIRRSVEQKAGQNIEPPADEVGKEETVRTAIEERAGCRIEPGKIKVAGTNLNVISDGYLLRLARFGLMIISAGDPTPFIHSLVNWAVASAIMDDSDFSDLVCWVVRLSDWDVDTILLREARSLLARKEPTASEAARLLLRAVGTRESQSLHEQYDLTPEWVKDRQNKHASDPCTSLFSWTEAESISCLGREDVPLHIILERATLPVVDPSITVPTSLIRRAREALACVNPAMIHASLSKTIEAHHLETLSQAFCAHAPSELADFMRAVVRTMPERDLGSQYSLAMSLPDIALLLREEEISAILRTMSDLSADASEWSSDDQSGPRHTRKIAEAWAFSAIAPHLSSSDFLRRLITRPVRAWDLVGFELWFAPVAVADSREVIKLLHSPADEATLYRVLWALPHLSLSFSDVDRTRLVNVGDSEVPKIRSGTMRVAVLTRDEALGKRIADLGRSTHKDIDPWEEQWLTLLLARFSGHIPFEDIARRLRPSAIGIVIAERGYRSDEIETYARCLDQEWQRIVSAVDPEIERLPQIAVSNDPTDGGGRLPELCEPQNSRAIRLDRSNSWTSGRSVEVSELKELFNAGSEEKARELNEDLRRRAAAILAAWRTDAFEWYGRRFSVDVLDKLYLQHPNLVERWIEPALHDSPTGFSTRVRLGTFLEPICRVLLDRNAKVGLQLWRVLHNREDNPVVFDSCDIAFHAEDSSESKCARELVLNACWNDGSIARVAFSGDRSGRRDWMNEAIAGLISSPHIWRRMKALTLASFSDITLERFEELVSRAAVGDSWVERSLGPLRENVRTNELARYWYLVFLTAEDPDAAWCALQIVLSLADERLLNWRVELEQACAGSQTSQMRVRFLGLIWSRQGDLRKEIGRERARKDRLFGIKIRPGEIFPFMQH